MPMSVTRAEGGLGGIGENQTLTQEKRESRNRHHQGAGEKKTKTNQLPRKNVGKKHDAAPGARCVGGWGKRVPLLDQFAPQTRHLEEISGGNSPKRPSFPFLEGRLPRGGKVKLRLAAIRSSKKGYAKLPQRGEQPL